MPSQAPRHLKTIFGANVRTARRLLALSQRQLADRVDVDPMAVSRWERGMVIPGSENLVRLAAGLEVSVDWLFTDHPQPQEQAA